MTSLALQMRHLLLRAVTAHGRRRILQASQPVIEGGFAVRAQPAGLRLTVACGFELRDRLSGLQVYEAAPRTVVGGHRLLTARRRFLATTAPKTHEYQHPKNFSHSEIIATSAQGVK